MKLRDNFFAIFLCILTGVLMFISLVRCIPLNNKAAGWMEESRSYSHLGGGSKFSKAVYSSQPPRSTYQTGGNSNKTLAAILLLTVFGIGATAFFVVICSKITKKEEYDAVKGMIY